MEKTGVELIAIERKRQIEELGFDYSNDKLYSDNQLSDAAICYAMQSKERDIENEDGVSLNVAIWPWDRKYWKPTPEDRIKELSKAGYPKLGKEIKKQKAAIKKHKQTLKKTDS